MKCARLNLQERSKPVVGSPSVLDKPRRYCQRRMVNPEHSDDSRWTDVKYHNTPNPNSNKHKHDNNPTRLEHDGDLVLTVQNLKFQGDVQERTRPRTSFKYKSLSGNRKHRMFIRQVADDLSYCDEDRSSELTSYYFDDYVKYILSTDRSRPSSSKSSIFLQDLSGKYEENKSTQVKDKPVGDTKKCRKMDLKEKKTASIKAENKEVNNNSEDMQNTQVTFHKTAKRRSLTISRAQSPETIQVIRVDVVCNYSTSSAMTNYEDNKSCAQLSEKDIENVKFKTPHFADKYLLTNTVKSVNENLSCGSKVTLLCRTFKLSDRSKFDKCKKNAKDTSKGFRNRM